MKVFVSATSFTKPENKAAQQLLEEFFDEVVYNDLGIPLKDDQILTRLAGCDAYIAGLDYITAEVIGKMPSSVKVISRYGVGVDRVDLEAAKKRGITVTFTPGANANAVCELTFAMMLCAARNVPALDQAVQEGRWPRVQGIELAGKTLGIAGLGAIGKALAVRARAFEMQVVAYDPCFDHAFAQAHGIRQMELDELIACSNILSLHVPLNEHTRHMVDERRIRSMPKGAILVNTARGGLIDEDAAYRALQDGHLKALCLDAFEQEPPAGSPLLDMPGVISTPHTGAHTAEAVAKMGMMSVTNAIAVLQGEPCPYII